MSHALLNLTNPAELVAAVPYVMGYRPHHELIVFAMTGPTVDMTEGISLDDLHDDNRNTTVARLVRTCVRPGSTGLVAIAYGDSKDVAPVMDAVTATVQAAGIDLVDAIRVDGDRYWSYTCTQPECCPPHGTVFDSTFSPVAAHCVAAGLTTVDSRADIAARLAPVKGSDSAAMFEAIHRVMADHIDRYGQDMRCHRHYGCHGRAMLDRVMAEHALPGFDDIAGLGMYLRHRDVQARALELIDNGHASSGIKVWVRLTRHLPPPLQSRPAALAAYSAWRGGHTVLAHTAVSIAQRVRPDSTNVVAQACQYLIEHQVSPRRAPGFADVVARMTSD